MTHIWSPTLFPRGIMIFQGVLNKFPFLQNFHIWEKFDLRKDLKYEHQSNFPLWGRVKINFRDRYGKPNIYSMNSSHSQVFFTGLSKNDFGIVLQILTHPLIHVIDRKLCKLGNGETPPLHQMPPTSDAPHVGHPLSLQASHVSCWVPCWKFEKLQIMPLGFGYLESSEKSEKKCTNTTHIGL